VKVAEKNQVYLAWNLTGSISLNSLGVSPKFFLSFNRPGSGSTSILPPHRGTYVGTTRSGFEWKLAESPRPNEIVVLTPVAHLVRHVHIKDVIGKEAVALR